MRTNIFLSGLILTATLAVASMPSGVAAYDPWQYDLRCEPSDSRVDDNEYVTFTAYSDNDSEDWSDLQWSALGGRPSEQDGGRTFRTRFNTDSITEIRVVYVTDGYRTASCEVRVDGDERESQSTLRCSPSSVSADSGDRVTFTARGGDGEYEWYAPGGSPSFGDDDDFRSRFYNDSWYDQYHTVTVTSDWQTATCTVRVRGNGDDDRTQLPAPRATLRCSTDVATVNSGVLVVFTARGGDGSYTWYTTDGNPTFGDDDVFRTRLYNYGYYPEYRGATVTSGSQSQTCLVTVNGGSQWPVSSPPAWPIYETYMAPSTTSSSTGVRSSATGQSGSGTGVSGNTTSGTGTTGTGASGTDTQGAKTSGANATISDAAAVKTGPTDPVVPALLLALLMTGLYAAYTRTDLFGRRIARAEVARLARRNGLNFSR